MPVVMSFEQVFQVLILSGITYANHGNILDGIGRFHNVYVSLFFIDVRLRSNLMKRETENVYRKCRSEV